jgi:hypothetical protein
MLGLDSRRVFVFPLFLLLACPAEDPPVSTVSSTGEEAETSSTTSSGSSEEGSSSGGSSSSSGIEGCQMEMDGADVLAFAAGRAGRMPTLAETQQLSRAISSTTVSGVTLTHVPEPLGGGFIQRPDGGGMAIECDVWAQDCPAGETCMPWATDGGTAWNATTCSPVDADPDQVGEECVVEGSGVSGIDSCDLAHMCWNVDMETNMGTCIAFCSGSEAMPTCDPPGTACSISNEGVLILCLPLCNPLADECAEDEGCYPSGDVFQCAPDASGGMGAAGDPCEFLNVCDPGLMCANPDTVPGCNATGCCSPFCVVGDDSPCLEGQTCVPFYEMGDAPDMCLEDVGVCVAQ